MRENCKRILNGVSSACKQANAIFELEPTDVPGEEDAVSTWLSENRDAVLLGVAGQNSFHEDIYKVYIVQLFCDFDSIHWPLF